MKSAVRGDFWNWLRSSTSIMFPGGG